MNRRQRRLQPAVARHAIRPQAVRTAEPSSPSQPWWQNDWVILAGLLFGFAIYRFIILAADPGPPGSDAGNWLAFTRDLFGRNVKSAESMYFPGVLVILKALLVFLPDLAALKVLAVTSSLAIGVPFYFIARGTCSKPTALLLTALLLMAGFLLEMMVWGGYPQLLASAYMLAAFYFVDRWLFEGNRKHAVYAAAFTGLVALTHHFMLLMLVASMAVYVPLVAFRLRAQLLTFVKRGLIVSAMTAGACLISVPWYLKYLSLLSGGGSLNAAAGQITSRGDILSFVFSEAPLTWIALCSIVPLVAMLPFGNESMRRLRPIAAALILGPTAVFMATHELRALQPLQAGGLLCLGILAAYAQTILDRADIRPMVATAGRATLGIAAVALALIIIPNGNGRFEASRHRNGAMDASAVQAMNWLRENTAPGSVILPGSHDNRVIYAWWVEGFAQRPAYGLVDPRFLAFKDEHKQAEIAARIVDVNTPVDEAQRLLDDAGIRYLFIYKPSDGEFQHLADSLPVTVSYQNDEFVILKLPVQTATAHE